MREIAMELAKGCCVIHNGRLFDGNGKPPIPDGQVAIQDGVIRYAGPASEAPDAPIGCARIDAEGGDDHARADRR